MRDLILFLLILAAGFVASGVIASGFVLVSRRPLSQTSPSSEAMRLVAVGLTIFTGPVILAGNAIKARHGEQPPAYLALALSVVALWSFVLGLFIVSIALTIPEPVWP